MSNNVGENAAQEELDRFRREWQAELQTVQARKEGPAGSVKSSASGSSAQAAIQTPGVPFLPGRSRFARAEAATLPADATAVEVYAAAVEAERSARLNEATALYRRAFKLDSDVERAYHAYSVVKKDEEKPSEEDELAFNFARTIQLGEDYVDPNAGDTATHPSSTFALQHRLIKSIESHPFGRTIGSDEATQFLPDTDQHAYHADNENLPIHFARLPIECIVQILLHLVIPRDPRFFPRLEDLEIHFARLCRRSRLDSLEPALWRAICERVYQYPQIPEGELVSRLVRKHGGDWRRMYLSQPRLRTDGCFIGVQRYVRRGHQESAWVSPSYSVTYFRFLRLYADGRCLSLQTTIEPGEIVRQLQPNLRIAGLLTGQWTLSHGAILRCKLEDPALPSDKRKYSFQLEARLKSSTRGRMNKLEILRLATCRRETEEVEELPLNPDHARPFYFSPVSAWER